MNEDHTINMKKYFVIYIMHAYKIYGIYLTFIAFSAMLTNHTFTDYFGTTVLFINSEFP